MCWMSEKSCKYVWKSHNPICLKVAAEDAREVGRVIAQAKISLKKLLGEIEESEWQTIEYRQGTKGKLVREAVLKKVWIWKKGTAEIEETEVLISRKSDKTEVKYSLCDEPQGELNVEVALWRQMQRYWIERGFQEVKEQIGLHQYQVRGWKAWQHHIALTMMALHFILEPVWKLREES